MLRGGAKWVVLGVTAMVVAVAGLMVGKSKEKEFLERLYNRHNFTLLDDKGNFFELAKQKDFLLLVFTPDGIPPTDVQPMRKFALQAKTFRDLKIQLVMITRTNREIARNFRDAARFPGVLLYDPSGAVGRMLEIWKDYQPVDYWAFTLVNSQLDLLWGEASKEVPTPVDLIKDLKKNVPKLEMGK